MGYIEESINPDEKIIHIGRVSVFPLISLMMFGFFLILLASAGISASGMSFTYRSIYALVFLAGLYPFFYTFMYVKNTQIGFTDKRFFLVRGIFRKSVMELDVADVELIVAGKGLFGKYMNYGTVAVLGSGGILAVVKGAGNPDELVSKLMEFQETGLK